jgi:hypothetical protein
MSQSPNRQWRLARRPVGMVSETDFEYREEPLPQIGDGQALVRNLYVSFDPAMRGWMEDRKSYIPPVGIGEVMRAGCVAQVLESKAPGLAPGDFVQGLFGWQEYAVAGPGLGAATKIPPGTPLTWPLGVLGITGLTAYFGLLDLGKPKPGETVLVSGAAGATGSVVAQIAKRVIGCRVVGIAGGREKCAWLTGELGFDAAINYKDADWRDQLRRACPGGIDIDFENVGGEIMNTVMAEMNLHGRVVLCGLISEYNASKRMLGPYDTILMKRLTVSGFIILDYAPRFTEAVMQLGQWMMQGKLRHVDTIVEGLDAAPEALNMLFDGENRGKLLIKVS